MNGLIKSNLDYIATVTWWVKRFSEVMSNYANASLAILSYYLKGNSECVVCPSEIPELKIYGEAMRVSMPMFAAAEDSGLFAEAIPEFFRLAFECHTNWCVTNKDILFLLRNTHLSRYIPFAYRFIAESVVSENATLLKNEKLWGEYIESAKRALGERNSSGR